jgi:hypothetical protein
MRKLFNISIMCCKSIAISAVTIFMLSQISPCRCDTNTNSSYNNFNHRLHCHPNHQQHHRYQTAIKTVHNKFHLCQCHRIPYSCIQLIKMCPSYTFVFRLIHGAQYSVSRHTKSPKVPLVSIFKIS